MAGRMKFGSMMVASWSEVPSSCTDMVRGSASRVADRAFAHIVEATQFCRDADRSGMSTFPMLARGQLEQAMPHGVRCRRGARVDAQLVEDVEDVVLDRALAQG